MKWKTGTPARDKKSGIYKIMFSGFNKVFLKRALFYKNAWHILEDNENPSLMRISGKAISWMELE